MKIKSIKSQISLLITVGLALFIVVGFVLYLSKSAIKKQTQQTIKRIEESGIEEQPIKDFVLNCLDKLSKDAIVLLGRQGGYIYKSQGGLIPDNLEYDKGLFFVKYKNFDATYNIIPPRFAIAQYSSYIPDYPWLTFPYAAIDSNEEIFQGYFGISENILPSLDSSEYSIKNQIENFIDSKMPSCANLDLFKEQGYDIEINNTKTQVTIGSKGINIKSKIPLKIINTATKKTAELEDFSTNLDIRLRDLYFYVKQLINNDITNIKFDIDSQENDQDSIKVEIVKDVYSNNNIKADIVIITDEKSLIYGKPFQYIFARRNRAPAIYYIKNNNLEFEAGYQITEKDLLGNSGLKAEDPDEDELDFTVTPALPKVLDIPQINFKVEVSDGKLSDYQIITVNSK